jgi:hypothetical protein
MLFMEGSLNDEERGLGSRYRNSASNEIEHFRQWSKDIPGLPRKN